MNNLIEHILFGDECFTIDEVVIQFNASKKELRTSSVFQRIWFNAQGRYFLIEQLQ